MKRSKKILLLLSGLCSCFLLAGCKSETVITGPHATPSTAVTKTITIVPTETPKETPKETPIPTVTKEITPTPTVTLSVEEEMDAKIETLLSQMSVEEKIAQLFFVRVPDTKSLELVIDKKPGGYLMFGRDFKESTTKQVTEQVKAWQDAATIPMFIGVDCEGGTVTRISRYSQYGHAPFLSSQAIYQKDGFDGIIDDTKDKAEFLKGFGINVNFAPVCDVSTNPSDFIYQRSFGQEAKLTASYVSTVTSQMKKSGLGSVLKHFPGYGNNGDTHTDLITDDRSYDTFLKSDLIPFEEGINAGADFVLVSHNIVVCMDENAPASLSEKVHTLLREDLGFHGVIITDDLSMGAIKDYMKGKSAAVKAVLAGNDMLCSTDFLSDYEAVKEAYDAGLITKERLDQSVERILRTKYSLGLID